MNPKLVRNLIPTIIAQEKKQDGSSRIPQFYQANDQEYWKKLKEKLLEEVTEFIDSEEIIELADIFEVLEAIMVIRRVSLDQLTIIKNNKARTYGTFSEKIILTSKGD